jgi:hypothetical protein
MRWILSKTGTRHWCYKKSDKRGTGFHQASCGKTIPFTGGWVFKNQMVVEKCPGCHLREAIAHDRDAPSAIQADNEGVPRTFHRRPRFGHEL